VTTHVNLAGHYLVIAHTGDFEVDYRGVYDTEAKARSVARMHFNDTGQMVDVLRLETPDERREQS
jgi:hypothetical protein